MRAAAVASGLLLTAATLSGCASDEPATTSTSSPATAEPGDDLGKPWEFTGPDGRIGTLTFTDIAAVPADCLLDPLPTGHQALALRVELVNDTALELTEPGADMLRVNDTEGFSHDVKDALLEYTCKPQFPELTGAPTPGKAVGWTAFISPVATPTAVVYTPLVWAADASLDNFDVVRVEPNQIVVRLPQTISATPSPAPTPAVAPTTEPEPTTAEPAPTTRAAPAAAVPSEGQVCDIDSDTWATSSDGGQLRCAYAGNPTPKWVASLPYIGVREPGSPCRLGEAVADSPTGVPMVCVGTSGDGEWQPGP